MAAYPDSIAIFIVNRSMSRVHFEPIISVSEQALIIIQQLTSFFFYAQNASIEEPGTICHLSFMDTSEGKNDSIVLVAVMCRYNEKRTQIKAFTITLSQSEAESTCHLVQFVIDASKRKASPSIRVHGRLRLDQGMRYHSFC